MSQVRFTSEEQINEYFQDQIEDLSKAYSDLLGEIQIDFRQGLKESREAKDFALARLRAKGDLEK